MTTAKQNEHLPFSNFLFESTALGKTNFIKGNSDVLEELFISSLIIEMNSDTSILIPAKTDSLGSAHQIATCAF